MKKKIFQKIILSAFLMGVMFVGAVSANFVDMDVAVNTFTIGKIEIDLLEPGWEAPDDIVPEQEVEKDPYVENTGEDDAFVFMEVIVPYAKVETANEDGTRNPAADTQLFTYEVNSGWVEARPPQKDFRTKTVSYLYAYGTSEAMTVLAPGTSTNPVFDQVKFANVIEDESLEKTSYEILVNAYGIQVINVDDGKVVVDGDNADGKVSPTEVWTVVLSQDFNEKMDP